MHHPPLSLPARRGRWLRGALLAGVAAVLLMGQPQRTRPPAPVRAAPFTADRYLPGPGPGEGASPFSQAFERGVAAYNADDLDLAADAFEEAVRIDPENAEARINLGLLYLRIRRADDAMRELSYGAALQRRRRHRPSPGDSATPGSRSDSNGEQHQGEP